VPSRQLPAEPKPRPAVREARHAHSVRIRRERDPFSDELFDQLSADRIAAPFKQVRLALEEVGYDGFLTPELRGGDRAYLTDLSERIDRILAM